MTDRTRSPEPLRHSDTVEYSRAYGSVPFPSFYQVLHPTTKVREVSHTRRLPRLGGVRLWSTILSAALALVIGLGPTLMSARPLSYEQRLGATVRVLVFAENAKGRGTGVLVAPDVVLTAKHVVEEADSISIQTRDGNSYWPRRVWTSPSHDTALIFLVRPTSEPVARIKCQSMSIGETYASSGHPLFQLWGYYPLTITGGDTYTDANVPTLGIIDGQGMFMMGISGGPVWDNWGHVVGTVHTMMTGVPGLPFPVPSGYGGVLPSKHWCAAVKHALDRKGAPVLQPTPNGGRK